MADQNEAVIVAATRSPIGRANKGSLVSIRPDDMAAQIVNPDPVVPLGVESTSGIRAAGAVAQPRYGPDGTLGYPGYKLTKIRRTYKDGKVIKTDKWKLAYQPVVEYARLGINPNPNLPAPKPFKAHGPKPTSGKFTVRQ